MNTKLLSLVLKTVAKSPEIEYVHYVVGIVNHCLQVKELRHVVLTEGLKPEGTYEGDFVFTYLALLSRFVEK